jgi:hypothetical protein
VLGLNTLACLGVNILCDVQACEESRIVCYKRDGVEAHSSDGISSGPNK